MGGILGMTLAALPQKVISRLLINDIGAVIPEAGLKRIKTYVGTDPTFNSHDEAVEACRGMLASFGPHTDEQFALLHKHYLVQRADDATKWTYHYDPHIVDAFKAAPDADVVLWPVFDAITCPTHVIRGADSDILQASVLAEMKTRGPKVTATEFAGIGHAPTLITQDQVDDCVKFFAQKSE
eukprot:TRINITY_DN717_c0_g1_i1.p2 TRINITY_DN717_c0_g1~~TRINITY_DN717_c0_g1_i1.p2  ORF type:complete len:182 (+),score=65.50 TRINITY_DN717_c0_g1_i1:279-824(+)